MILKVPIEISDENIKEYQRMYKENYGEDISFEKAQELALSLVRFVYLILKGSSKNL